MIKLYKGNMFHSKAEALVNTVNTVGVMGKGIALQFKKAFPNNFKVYARACKNKELEPGKLLYVWDENIDLGRRLIINFPTKIHWRNPSKYEYIEKGLIALRDLLIEKKIKSIAIPPLGCGNGGLDWNKVRPMIEEALKGLDTEIMIYEPNSSIKATLKKEKTNKEVKLTPARASLLYALFAYESMGENSSLLVANKLAYFLQRKGQNLNLNFIPHYYGPYAADIEKVLYYLNGVYLNGMNQERTKPFEPLRLNYERWNEINYYIENKLSAQDSKRVKSLKDFLAGFSSELALEILATTDFILNNNPDYNLEDVIRSIENWNLRKRELFKPEYIQISYNYLKDNPISQTFS